MYEYTGKSRRQVFFSNLLTAPEDHAFAKLVRERQDREEADLFRMEA